VPVALIGNHRKGTDDYPANKWGCPHNRRGAQLGMGNRPGIWLRGCETLPLITFKATTPEEWSRQINVGIGGLFNCTYAVWNQMKAQGGGHIIGIASGFSIRGYL
jgi:NAD(P)-dependent dehydrogenase (short-subunit alcohol dehydrogenase family)